MDYHIAFVRLLEAKEEQRINRMAEKHEIRWMMQMVVLKRTKKKIVSLAVLSLLSPLSSSSTHPCVHVWVHSVECQLQVLKTGAGSRAFCTDQHLESLDTPCGAQMPILSHIGNVYVESSKDCTSCAVTTGCSSSITPLGGGSGLV